ncbi:SRPBCC domain-containing protein [Streptomyces sp. NPDC001388]|uniref:SRPBCC domain-containing protein n=1 Tax=Streptomyces sp. NPDC001388 TaxID=3364568 RepID=UPI0036A21301
MPELAGIHHVKIPVTDLDRARAWYGRVFGLKITHEFPDADGVLQGVGGPVPGLGDTLLALRVNPEAAHGCRNFDPVSFGVRDRAAVEAWAAHLDTLGVPHSPLIEATFGRLLVFDDPDGIQLHLYGPAEHAADRSDRPEDGRPAASPDLTGIRLTLDDGRPAVRFTRTYAHPVASIWHLVTDPAELAGWFPSRVETELRPGAAIRFSGDPRTPESTGRVLAVDAPRHLSFAWGGDELRLDLEADDDGTRLTLTNVLAAADASARNAAGWEVCLAALDALAESGAPVASDGGTRSWEAYYRAYVEAGFPSGAPVPGHG